MHFSLLHLPNALPLMFYQLQFTIIISLKSVIASVRLPEPLCCKGILERLGPIGSFINEWGWFDVIPSSLTHLGSEEQQVEYRTVSLLENWGSVG